MFQGQSLTHNQSAPVQPGHREKGAILGTKEEPVQRLTKSQNKKEMAVKGRGEHGGRGGCKVPTPPRILK